MGLTITLDCRCIADGRVRVPARWAARVAWKDGCPMVAEKFSGEDLPFARWYWHSCPHQRAAEEFTSGRLRAIWNIARAAEAAGLEQFPTLLNFFDDPEYASTGGDGHVSPKRCAAALSELDLLAKVGPPGPTAVRLIDEDRDRPFQILLYCGSCGCGRDRADRFIDSIGVDWEGVRLSRCPLEEPEKTCRSTILMFTRRFEQIELTDTERPTYAAPSDPDPVMATHLGADEQDALTRREFLWRDVETGLEVRTPACIWSDDDYVPFPGILPPVPRRVRWELFEPSAALICEPMRVVCAAAVAAGTPVGWGC